MAGTVTGTVRSAQTAKPVAGALVQTAGTETLTDSAGRFALGPLEPGSHNLSVSGDGFETILRNDVYVPGEGDVRIDVDLAPRAVELDKMTVRAASFRRPADLSASAKTMTLDEILRAPGALADVQRAVQDLPSVASGGDNVNEVVVRGGVPGENLFVLDNIDIPNPNHFAQQGSGGGVVSLINPLLVKGLTFSAGAPPAQYGGKASSVLAVDLRDGNDKLLLGGLDVGIGGAGAHLEGPLWPGATFMASGTRSFLDLAANFDPSTAIPEYWGCQAKFSQRLGAAHKLGVNGIFGANSIVIRNAIAEVGTRGDVISSGGSVYAAGTTLRSFWTDRLSSTVTLSGTGNGFLRREYTPGDSGAIAYFRNESMEQEQTVKAEAALDLAGDNRIVAGGLFRRADFDIRLSERADTLRTYTGSGDSVGTPALDSAGQPVVTRAPRRGEGIGYLWGGYVSSILRPWKRLKIVPGLRVDGFTYTGHATVSPRINGSLAVLPGLDLTAAFGVQYQNPDYVSLIISPENRSLGPKRAITGMGGVEYVVDRWNIKTSVEGFYKQYDGIPVDSSVLLRAPITAFTATNTLLDRGQGRSYGIEFFVHKKLTARFSGSAAYSYSQSWYDDIRPGHTGESYPGDFDFRNNFTCTGGWKFELLNRLWYQRLRDKMWFVFLSWIMPVADRNEWSLRFRYLGGRPYTQPQFVDANRVWAILPDQPLNHDRYPPYHSLDVRWERRYGFGFLQMIYYFEFQNLYNRRNVWQYLYVDGRSSRSVIEQLPFFPAGGMIIGF